jgi:hypothetical protein
MVEDDLPDLEAAGTPSKKEDVFKPAKGVALFHLTFAGPAKRGRVVPRYLRRA